MKELERLRKLAGLLTESTHDTGKLDQELDHIKDMVDQFNATIDTLDMMDQLREFEATRDMSIEQIEQAFKEKFGQSSKEMVQAEKERIAQMIKTLDQRSQKNLKSLADHMTINPVGVWQEIKDNSLIYYVKSPKSIVVKDRDARFPAASLPKSEEDWLESMGVTKVKKPRRSPQRPMGPWPGYD